MKRMLTLIGLTALVLWCAACGQDATGPPEIPDLQLQIVAGGDQDGIVGRELGTPVTVEVVNAVTKSATVGQIVNFVITEGGGSVFAGAAITDAQGRAADRWTLGELAGSQRLEVRAVTAEGQAITYAVTTATAQPDAPDSVVLAMDAVQGWVGEPILASEVVTQVLDQFGNVVTVAPMWTASAPFLVSADTLRALQEVKGSPTVGAGNAQADIEVSVLRDLTLHGWEFGYICGRSDAADSLVFYGTVDSIQTNFVWGNDPRPYVLRGTLWTDWYRDGLLSETYTNGSLVIYVKEQSVGRLTYWKIDHELLNGNVLTYEYGEGVWDGVAYEGADLCAGHNIDTPLRLIMN